MSATKTHHSPLTSTILILLPLALITLGCIFYPDNFHIISFVTTSFSTLYTANNTSNLMSMPSHNAKLNIFFGVITTAVRHERRHLLRSVYAVQTRNLTTAKVHVRFIVCNSIGEVGHMFLSLESILYDDIIVLDCTENLNDGKTYTYFSSLPSMFNTGANRPYDYVVKADDDAYFRLDNLALFLKDKPREDLYYGMEMNCDYFKAICGRHKTFMAGFGYVLSWDLVEWIAESDIARNNKTGLEDLLLAKWLNFGGRGNNRYNGQPVFYDYKDNLSDTSRPGHELIPETVAVHQLKENFKWAKTLRYFNVTRSVKPFKLQSIKVFS